MFTFSNYLDRVVHKVVHKVNFPSSVIQRLRLFSRTEKGMTTAEYAIGTIAAAAFAAVLYAVVTGDTVADLVASVVRSALSVKF